MGRCPASPPTPTLCPSLSSLSLLSLFAPILPGNIHNLISPILSLFLPRFDSTDSVPSSLLVIEPAQSMLTYVDVIVVVHACVHVWMSMMYACTCVYVSICVYLVVKICVYVRMCVYICVAYVYMYVFMCVYVYHTYPSIDAFMHPWVKVNPSNHMHEERQRRSH